MQLRRDRLHVGTPCQCLLHRGIGRRNRSAGGEIAYQVSSPNARRGIEEGAETRTGNEHFRLGMSLLELSLRPLLLGPQEVIARPFTLHLANPQDLDQDIQKRRFFFEPLRDSFAIQDLVERRTHRVSRGVELLAGRQSGRP